MILEPLGLEALEKLASGLDTLTNDTDSVAKTCIEAATPTMESIYKATMAGASASLGGAASSSNAIPTKKNALGVYTVARPVGYAPSPGSRWPEFHKWEATHRTRYGMVAALFNYGVPAHAIFYNSPNKYNLFAFKGSSGQFTHPGFAGAPGWAERAASAAEGPVTQLVIEKFEAEVKRLCGE